MKKILLVPLFFLYFATAILAAPGADKPALTGDTSSQDAFLWRLGKLIPNTEAEWFFDSLIAMARMRLARITTDPERRRIDMRLAAIHIKRALGQITGKEITADGKPVDAWLAPESINTVVIDGREHYLPSPIAPLNWAKAALMMALRDYEKAAEGRIVTGGNISAEARAKIEPRNPNSTFETQDLPPPPDYGFSEAWAALPDKKDSADFAPSNTKYPESQATAAAKVYAPRYREANLYAFFDDKTSSGIQAVDLAYHDVERAFLHYIKVYNQGRPFILAGHSQGSLHGSRLLQEQIIGTPLMEGMVAAYLIGGTAPAKIPGIQPSRSATDTGALIGWNTYTKEGDPAIFTNGIVSPDFPCVP